MAALYKSKRVIFAKGEQKKLLGYAFSDFDLVFSSLFSDRIRGQLSRDSNCRLGDRGYFHPSSDRFGIDTSCGAFKIHPEWFV